MIRSNTTHTFAIDRKSADPMMGLRTLARGYCNPHGEWFSLTLANSKEDVLISWEEWDQIVAHISELKEAAKLEVIFSAQGVPTK